MASGPKLEIGDNDRFQRIEWFVQRVGWVAIGLVLLAALLGLLGSAHFGQRQLASPDGGLEVEYLRFARYETDAALTVRAPAAGAPLRVWLPVAYLERMRLERVEPQPEHVAPGADVHVFTFATAPSPTAQVVFHFRPASFGRINGRIGLVDGPELEFRQRVYP